MGTSCVCSSGAPGPAGPAMGFPESPVYRQHLVTSLAKATEGGRKVDRGPARDIQCYKVQGKRKLPAREEETRRKCAKEKGVATCGGAARGPST